MVREKVYSYEHSCHFTVVVIMIKEGLARGNFVRVARGVDGRCRESMVIDLI